MLYLKDELKKTRIFCRGLL